jgi:hypothetical protein
MTTYCSVDDLYLNKGLLSTNNEYIDKIARDVNNNKKKSDKTVKALNNLQKKKS